MVETTISSKSFVYGSHIAVATAQDCAQICYQNATCLSAGFVPSSGSESAVCLPIIQGRPLCDQKLKTVRSQGSPVILDCFTCPTHICKLFSSLRKLIRLNMVGFRDQSLFLAGVIDATPTSVPISPEVSVAATTNVTDNLSSVESTVLGVFFTTSPASLSTEVNATSTAGLPNKTETVNETNTLNVTSKSYVLGFGLKLTSFGLPDLVSFSSKR